MKSFESEKARVQKIASELEWLAQSEDFIDLAEMFWEYSREVDGGEALVRVLGWLLGQYEHE